LAGHGAFLGEMNYRQKILVPKCDGTDLEDLNGGQTTVLKWILRKHNLRM
jgi:hypothetical protein